MGMDKDVGQVAQLNFTTLYVLGALRISSAGFERDSLEARARQSFTFILLPNHLSFDDHQRKPTVLSLDFKIFAETGQSKGGVPALSNPVALGTFSNLPE